MKLRNRQSGFTAIELLITLFVAAGFLIAGYQLFNVIIKDGGQARAESRAGNIAYDYIRRYSSYATDPCVAQAPLNNSSVTIDGLSNVKITVTITCPEYSTTNISKIEVTVTYNTPQQTVQYGTLITGSGVQVNDVTDGLIGWWKLNGNANTSVGTSNGSVVGATLVDGQNGSPEGAYSFDGVDEFISIPTINSFPTSTATISFWAYPRSTTANSTMVISTNPNVSTNRVGIYFPWGASGILWDFGSDTSRLVKAWDNSWQNQWSYWTFTASPSGRAIYRNGTLLLSNTSSANFTIGTISFYFARAEGGNYWNGNLDDVRFYNRVLSTDEMNTIYSGGAK